MFAGAVFDAEGFGVKGTSAIAAWIPIFKEENMRRVKRTVRVLAMMMVLCMMLATFVSAADNGSVWLNAMQTADDGTDVYIVADTTVTDGLVELTYDNSDLTYDSIQVNEACVGQFAVNTSKAGTVKVSWVAPNADQMAQADWLVKVSFSGEGDVALSGEMNDAQGNDVAQGAALDTAALKAAVQAAQNADEESFDDTLTAALAEAEAVLADPAATQTEVDTAANALNAALEALGLETGVNTGNAILNFFKSLFSWLS